MTTTATGTSGITISWHSMASASKYELDAGDEGSFELTGTEKKTITGLTCGTSYSFSVRAFGDGVDYGQSWGAWSSPVTGTPPPCKVSFSFSSYSVNEGSSVTITVRLSRSPNRSISIPVTVSPGNATSVSFSDTNSSDTFTYSAPQDSDCDDESITLGIGSLPTGVIKGSVPSSTISVSDDESCVNFSSSSYSVDEGSAVTVTVNIDKAPSTTLTIPVNVSPGNDQNIIIGAGNSSGLFPTVVHRIQTATTRR